MQTITVALDTLKSNPANPRRISDEKFSKLIDSLLSFPKMLSVRPIVVDTDMVIVAGNMRHKALLSIAGMSLEDIRKRLSAIPKYQAMDATEREYVTDFWLDFMDNPQVEVCTTEGMTDAEVREFIIKDNLPFGEWDFDMLANEWDEKELLDWGMDVWDTEGLGDDGDENAAKEDDYEIPDEVTTDIRRGDLFEIGPHRLLCGDSTSPEDWNKLMSGESADLVITDPPYNVDYTGKTKDALKIENDKKSDGDFYEFLLGFYKALAEHTKRGGVWYVWHADSEGANFRRAMTEAGIPVRQCLIWAKNSMVMGRQDYHWQHEPCLYGWKEGAAHGWYSDRKQTTLLQFDRPSRNAEHPTMKPVPLIGYQMANSSKAGDIVADGFGGSGTTMVAAHQIERKCRMMELDPKYCQVIIDRMRKLEPDLTIKKNGKDY